ncbi:hypothetical protein [Cupriavidus oxalaticus]|jgi:hypothetical protein|nr:hypothetical protein [Cupriavidus oxalaticus]WQD81916.1 hypothetical protein U0036_12525 [Cupriavidus oxalaticus]
MSATRKRSEDDRCLGPRTAATLAASPEGIGRKRRANRRVLEAFA